MKRRLNKREFSAAVKRFNAELEVPDLDAASDTLLKITQYNAKATPNQVIWSAFAVLRLDKVRQAAQRELLATFSSREREALTQEWLDLQAELFDYSRPAAERLAIEERLLGIAARRDAVVARATEAGQRLAELDQALVAGLT